MTLPEFILPCPSLPKNTEVQPSIREERKKINIMMLALHSMKKMTLYTRRKKKQHKYFCRHGHDGYMLDLLQDRIKRLIY